MLKKEFKNNYFLNELILIYFKYIIVNKNIHKYALKEISLKIN